LAQNFYWLAAQASPTKPQAPNWNRKNLGCAKALMANGNANAATLNGSSQALQLWICPLRSAH